MLFKIMYLFIAILIPLLAFLFSFMLFTRDNKLCKIMSIIFFMFCLEVISLEIIVKIYFGVICYEQTSARRILVTQDYKNVKEIKKWNNTYTYISFLNDKTILDIFIPDSYIKLNYIIYESEYKHKGEDYGY